MNSGNHPIKNLTKQLRRHRAFSRQNLPRISAFYLKLLIQEPFRILENFKYAKEIRTHRLDEDPIFIIGHWRSGTSFLQYLLSQDPQFGYMNKFQVVFPDVFLSSERGLKALVNKVPDTINLMRDAQNMSINLELDSPSEIEIALTTMISPTSLHWGHIFPEDAWEYFDKYLFFETTGAEEVQQWKRDYAYLIKKTSLKSGGRQLLIKSPGNACRMEKLLELYPNAKFIFIHRNPYNVFYSSKKLWHTLLDNLALQDFSEQQMEREIIAVYEKLMRGYLRQRPLIPSGQLTEIRFENFMDDPVKELAAVYSDLNIADFKQAKPHFDKFLENKAEGKSSAYDYEKPIIQTLNEKWKFAFQEWSYSMKGTSEEVPRQN